MPIVSRLLARLVAETSILPHFLELFTRRAYASVTAMTPVYVAMMRRRALRTRELRETDVGSVRDERMRKQRENGDLSERCRNDDRALTALAEGSRGLMSVRLQLRRNGLASPPVSANTHT